MKKWVVLLVVLFGLMMLSPYYADATESCSARAMCGLTCYADAPEGGSVYCGTDSIMVRCVSYSSSGAIVHFYAAQCSDCI